MRDPLFGVDLFQARPVAALRGPDPGWPAAETGQVVVHAREQAERGGAVVEQWLEGVCGRPAEQLHDSGVGQASPGRGQPGPVRGLQSVQSRVRLLGLAGSGRAIVLAQFLGAPQPVGSPAAGGLQAFRVVELGCEHRRDADRRQVAVAFLRQPREHIQHGQVAGRDRLVQPHLTHRPSSVSAYPWQMTVQDEREPAGHRAITTRSRLLSRSSAQS